MKEFKDVKFELVTFSAEEVITTSGAFSGTEGIYSDGAIFNPMDALDGDWL